MSDKGGKAGSLLSSKGSNFLTFHSFFCFGFFFFLKKIISFVGVEFYVNLFSWVIIYFTYEVGKFWVCLISLQMCLT
jgi:hypothetical protein